MWQAQQSDHITLDLRGDPVIEAMAVPDRKLIDSANREDYSRNLVIQLELLADES